MLRIVLAAALAGAASPASAGLAPPRICAPGTTPIAVAGLVMCLHPRRLATGFATFYDYSRRRTACGERFDPAALTAAHWSLPCGTLVEVTRGGGLAVTVRINDRGPAPWTGNIIDLTPAAARRLRMIDVGRARVTIEVVGRK